MKISRDLPQFDGEKTLIVVAGKQEARFFLAKDGVIEESQSFQFEKPKYSDREGFFMSRGKSGVYRSGAVYEFKKQRLVKELGSRLKEGFADIAKYNKIDKIYLLSPEHLENDVKKAIPPDYRKKIKFLLKGDYSHFHPFDILDKIASQKKEPAAPLKETTVRILRKPKMRNK
jgi:hypothetical protein